MSDVSMMSLMPTAMPRNGPSVRARGFFARVTKALMVSSCASIAAIDSASAAPGVSAPLSMRRCRSASEIIGRFLLLQARCEAGHLRLLFGASAYQDTDGRDKGRVA